MLVPEAVYAAVVERGHKVGYRDALAIKEKKAGGVDVVTLSDAAAYEADQWHDRANLGRGEAAAITLARRRDARCLTDDHAA